MITAEKRMKRVLFYYDNFCGPESRGGTEKATFRIAKALHKTGQFEVYNAFRRGKGPEMPISRKITEIDSKQNGKPALSANDPAFSVYEKVIKLPHSGKGFINALAAFIADNEIDAVVNMSRFFRHRLIVEAVGKSGRDVKVIFMQHFAPGSEWKKGTRQSGLHLLRLDPANPLYWLRATLYPLLKLPRRIAYPKAYRMVYEHSDRVVLLSKGYFEPYKNIARIEDTDKFAAIGNIFEKPADAPEISTLRKEKKILILSRMDEIQKRISIALHIWEKIEKESGLEDWSLDIVGSGHDMKALTKLARRLGLKRVAFHGWADPAPFLQQSSIMMMTSEYEGLPLSLLEAQAYGCVPVAFNSFASLPDVIENGKNGIIIENFGDTEEFTRQLSALMHNEEKLREMASQCSRPSEAFSSSAIASRWAAIL